MSAVSNGTVVNLFKKVYGDLKDLQPKDFPIQKQIPFSAKQKVGESYVEAVCLTAETGWTLAGQLNEAYAINAPIAGTVRQTEVKPNQTIIPSVLPWGSISRSAGAGEKAFFDATKFIVKNNIKSHHKLVEVLSIYGQAADLLGYVSYATATYRGVAFTNGTGTLGGIAFTNGVNAASKAILLAPGSFASGIWVGNEGCVVEQIDSTGAVVASGKLVTVESELGYITVDFTPVAPTATQPLGTVTPVSGTIRLGYEGMASGSTMLGIKGILSTQSGNLFGVSTSYSLWHGNYVNVNNVKFSFDILQSGVAAAVNRGGLDTGMAIHMNPRSWGKLITTEAGKRVYDSSYEAATAKNGMESIEFFGQNGKNTIYANRFVKEGDVLGLNLDDWSRSGSQEPSFTISGMNGEVVFPLENTAAYAFRSYADEYMFCNAPAKSILWVNVNDEASS
jgi:hypothetical protein